MQYTLRFLIVAGALALAACDGGSDGAADTDADTEGGSGGVDECDPVGAQPEQAALFNAPVEADVEVIQKAPTHPGEPGPDNLP